ncbi:MAG: lipase maturation factor family protein [Deltaproteobacteria bacterium]|nr:lipase maturation factor family protein [Deltaproteobacteria bacterium]
MSSFWCARFAFLRLLGLVYLVAFGGMLMDGAGLIGETGLLPADVWMADVLADAGGAWEATKRAPSIFWWTGFSDGLLGAVCGAGVVLSLAMVLGLANLPILLTLWGLYFSVVTVGQRWFHFGWESQLLETGLLACTLVPLLDPRPFRSRPSKVGVVLGWWLVARIMLGAGLIKLRGADCWTELTCLDWHFETQPIPGPLSALFHSLPHPALAGGVLVNHGVELLAPALIWGPRTLRHVAAAAMVAFQVTLILSGNLAFLNWLTLVPLLLLFDDRLVAPKAAEHWEERARRAEDHGEATLSGWAQRLTPWAIGAYALLVTWLSVPVVVNLFSAEQSMNRSFGVLRIVNTYGAFGSVGERRFEILVEGTAAEDPGEDDWEEFVFRSKPGPLDRRPPWITPRHHRLDWLAWFAGLEAARGQGFRREAWVAHLVWKLLEGDDGVRALMAPPCPAVDGRRRQSHCNPFVEEPPARVRVRLFEYRFSDGEDWWERDELGLVLPPMGLDDPELVGFLRGRGWLK